MFFRHFVTTIPVLLSFKCVVTGNEEQLHSSTENVSNTVQPDNSDLLEWIPPEKLKHDFPYSLSGYDYDNLPVLVHLWGKWNIVQLVQKGGQELEDFLRRNDQFFERVKKSYFRRRVNESEMGSGEDEIVLIIDYDGFNLEHFQSPGVMRVTVGFFEKLESCYEKISYGYIVNGTGIPKMLVNVTVWEIGANTLVDGLLNFGKGMMGRFLERVEIHGTNARKYIPQILKKIPRSELSSLYGGYDGFKPIAFY